MNKSQWLRHWNIIKRFEPGYDPKATVFGCEQTGKSGAVKSPEEAYWIYQERGKLHPSTDDAKVVEYIQRKAGMDLCVSLWKEDLKSQVRERGWRGVLSAQCHILELAVNFPISFLNSIGLLKIAELTIKQCGLRLGSIETLRLPMRLKTHHDEPSLAKLRKSGVRIVYLREGAA